MRKNLPPKWWKSIESNISKLLISVIFSLLRSFSCCMRWGWRGFLREKWKRLNFGWGTRRRRNSTNKHKKWLENRRISRWPSTTSQMREFLFSFARERNKQINACMYRHTSIVIIITFNLYFCINSDFGGNLTRSLNQAMMGDFCRAAAICHRHQEFLAPKHVISRFTSELH